MDKNGLKVNELAAEIGETTHVIRNWVRDFRDLIPITKNPAGFNIFTEDAIKVMKQIQRMSRQQKYSTKQIRFYLSNGGRTLSDTIPADPAIEDIKKMLEAQQDFNKALLDRLDEQQEYIKRSLDIRDQQLMQTIRHIQDQKRLKNGRKWWQFKNK